MLSSIVCIRHAEERSSEAQWQEHDCEILQALCSFEFKEALLRAGNIGQYAISGEDCVGALVKIFELAQQVQDVLVCQVVDVLGTFLQLIYAELDRRSGLSGEYSSRVDVESDASLTRRVEAWLQVSGQRNCAFDRVGISAGQKDYVYSETLGGSGMR